jgi:hypothetical protein
MSEQTVVLDFQRKVSEKVRVASEGIDRFRVFTPFMFEDGDHLAIVMRKEAGAWTLSDEGHTYMHLTYDLEEKDLRTGTRQKIINNALSVFAVDDREGELVLPITGDRYGDALFSFVQALLKITDVSYLSRERVKSTFMEDFRSFMEEKVLEARRTFDWHDPVHDPDGNYAVNCRINGMPQPLFVFALPNDGAVRDATISLLQFERWQLQFRSLAIFENMEEINTRVVARFSDVGEKMYSNLSGNRDRIEKFLAETIA